MSVSVSRILPRALEASPVREPLRKPEAWKQLSESSPRREEGICPLAPIPKALVTLGALTPLHFLVLPAGCEASSLGARESPGAEKKGEAGRKWKAVVGWKMILQPLGTQVGQGTKGICSHPCQACQEAIQTFITLRSIEPSI